MSPELPPKKLNERLTFFRKKSGLSQEIVANRLGWQQSRVSSYERAEGHRDHREPPLDALENLAKVYNVPVHLLAFGTGPGDIRPAPKLSLVSWNRIGEPKKGPHKQIDISWPIPLSAEASIAIIPHNKFAPHFCKKDLIVVDPLAPIEPGSYVVLRIDGENVIARTTRYRRPRKFRLLDHDATLIREIGNTNRVVGVIISSIHNYR
jgi:transcriptional regulator with XRE-family HTH domain